MTLKAEMTKEKLAFIQKNEKICNLYGIAYFVYYKCFQHEAFNKVVYIIIVGNPTTFIKGGLSFQNFPRNGGQSEFSHKKGGVGKIGDGSSRKGGISLSNTN